LHVALIGQVFDVSAQPQHFGDQLLARQFYTHTHTHTHTHKNQFRVRSQTYASARKAKSEQIRDREGLTLQLIPLILLVIAYCVLHTGGVAEARA
jgi:hypothetical protein